MKGRCLLGVDIGTYSSKGVLVEEDGQVIASHTVQHGIDMPAPGHFEHEADRVWWKDFTEIVRTLLETSGMSPAAIAGIGTSGIGSCVLPVDSRGRPLRPAILYGIDTRAAGEIESLERALGEDEILRISGARLSSQASGPKILWIRQNEPSVYRAARWFLTSQAYLVYRLTGLASIDVYTAGAFAPLFDVRNLRWAEEAARLITPLERLPRTYWSCEIVGTVTSAAAAQTGLAEGTPVIAGTTDAASEAVSAGVSEAGDMMLMFGSSVFFILKTRELRNTERFWSSNFLEPGTFALLGGMSTSGSLTTWFRDRFAREELSQEQAGGENAYALLAREAAESPPGANGLIALPYFAGERTPLHDHRARGMFFGLTLSHTRGDLYRAILEGVGFAVRHNLQTMREEGAEPARLCAVGGGVRNAPWMQAVADIADIELSVPQQQLGASYGDAFMAGVGVGLFGSLAEVGRWVRNGRSIKPDPAAHRRYDPLYRIFRSLYETNKALMHELHDSVER
ncbi:MAG: FGGY-family carbohydrate kinase [Spirochaetales bacterium]|nr:FGGY-family carbohydrate kinase [Spirochaetales bacterium]